MKTAVYKISNTVNSKLYFGISAYPISRWSTHKRRVRNGGRSKLYAAMDKYGVDKFIFEIVHWCDNRDDANDLEHFLIEECCTNKTGYNIREGGDSGAHSEETKAKIGLLGLGRQVTTETREKISRAHKGKGKKPLSEQTKAKLSAINKGKKHTTEAAEKIRTASAGRKYPNRKPMPRDSVERRAATLRNTIAKKAIPIVCNETGEVFKNMTAAATHFNVSIATVCNHCKGKTKSSKSGNTFSYQVK